MKIYDKNKSWEVVSPNATSLLKFMIDMETRKNYMNIKQCASILYILNQSIVVWGDDNYKDFIGRLPQEIGSYYMTVNSNQKGKVTVINRDNVKGLKNDFDFLFKLFSDVVSSMIINGNKKLFVEN